MTSIPIEQFGPDTDDALDAALDEAAQAGAFDLEFAAKEYGFRRAHDLGTALHLVGAGAGSTIVRCVTPGNGGLAVRMGAGFGSIQRMTIFGADPFHGFDIGIRVESPGWRFRDLRIENWSGQGFHFEGHTPSTNASVGTIEDTTIATCGHGGAKDGTPNEQGAAIFLDGGDANWNRISGVTMQDCRKGGYDSSELGNAWEGCVAEGCNDKFDAQVMAGQRPLKGYGFVTDDGNCRATFDHCYTENDSEADVKFPASIFGGLIANRGNALTIGPDGAHGSMPVVSQYVDPKSGKRLTIRALLGSAGGPAEGLSLYVFETDTGKLVCRPQTFRYGQSVPGWWALNHLGLQDAFRWNGYQFWVPGDLMLGRNGQPYGVRFAVGDSVNATPQDGGQWQPGDRLHIRAPLPGQPSEYVMTTTGWKVCGRVEP